MVLKHSAAVDWKL